jgi:copper chaperone CopZ
MLLLLGCSASGGPETAGGGAGESGAAAGSVATTPSSATSADGEADDDAPRPPKDPNAKYQRVSLEVPTMSCPFACWPKVKKTLEKQPGVGEVTLSPQKDKDAIDQPVVYVEATEAFQAEAAIAALTDAGFGGGKIAAAGTATPSEPSAPATE